MVLIHFYNLIFVRILCGTITASLWKNPLFIFFLPTDGLIDRDGSKYVFLLGFVINYAL